MSAFFFFWTLGLPVLFHVTGKVNSVTSLVLSLSAVLLAIIGLCLVAFVQRRTDDDAFYRW